MKRIGIVLPLLGISGGINIVLNWGVVLAKAGYRLDIILPTTAGGDIPFLTERDAARLHLLSVSEARRYRYHAVIATWWATLAVAAELEADRYAWFMQAYEGQFLAYDAPDQDRFDELVSSRLNVITTAHWLEQHIKRHYSIEPKQTFCVLSGLDKDLWKPVRRETPRPGGRQVCFLAEGPAFEPRKNVSHTIRLLEGLGVAYKWVGSVVDRSLVGPNCLGVEEQIPYNRMPEIYGCADVLVKASNAEGMFGPPLEMFATGGTVVAWHVQGAEEYMSDRYNSALVPLNSWSALAEAILELAHDPGRVRVLQENALATAEAWPAWDEQAEQIVTTIESLVPFGRCSLVRNAARNRFRPTFFSQLVAQGVQRALAEATQDTQRALAEAARAAQDELDRLRSGRAWRFVRLLQRVRRQLAPEGSRRWAAMLRVGRFTWRAGRQARRFTARVQDELGPRRAA
jgi:glycosyltransferase involved in cell wall biosynthesis